MLFLVTATMPGLVQIRQEGGRLLGHEEQLTRLQLQWQIIVHVQVGFLATKNCSFENERSSLKCTIASPAT